MKILADGDSLQSGIRALLLRRAAREGQCSPKSLHGGQSLHGGLCSPGSGRAQNTEWGQCSEKRCSEKRFSLIFVAAKPLPIGPEAEFILVEGGPDAADDRILELAEAGDLAVTRDIPLAERLAEKGVVVLNDRGEVFTLENVRERRSLRDRAAELRALGLAPESPRGSSWGPREQKAFADAFDRELSRALRAISDRP